MSEKLNFLLVSAPKSGSTSVAKYLNDHPEIFIPENKELFYLIADTIKKTSKIDPLYDSIFNKAILEKEAYDTLFRSHNSKIKGEATVHYLYHFKEVISKTKKEYGDIKIIILLRNPTERAFSNYNYLKKEQIITFEKALELEETRRERGYNSFWYFKSLGNYFKAVKAYTQNFSCVKVVLFEDLIEDPLALMQELYSFLGVNVNFIPNVNKIYNPTLIPKNKLIHILFFWKRHLGIQVPFLKKFKSKLLKTPETKMKQKTKSELIEYYKPNILKLQLLINKDLLSWLK